MIEKNKTDTNQQWKMYFWVRAELGMRKGKTAGQVGHCAARLSRMVSNEIWIKYLEYEVKYTYKVSDSQFDELIATAKQYPYEHLVIDAGKTQTPKDSATVLGIFTQLDLNPVVGEKGKRKYNLM